MYASILSPYWILNTAAVVWLGQISYSLYLWQQPFFSHRRDSRHIEYFGIALACLSYYLIEQPALTLREKRAAPLPAETALASTF